jgi:hypothetical protein
LQACGGAALAPAARCTVALRFTPATAGAHAAQLHVAGGTGALDFALRGTAIAAGGGGTADTGALRPRASCRRKARRSSSPPRSTRRPPGGAYNLDMPWLQVYAMP